MEKISNHKSFNYFVETPHVSRVNLYIHFCLQVPKILFFIFLLHIATKAIARLYLSLQLRWRHGSIVTWPVAIYRISKQILLWSSSLRYWWIVVIGRPGLCIRLYGTGTGARHVHFVLIVDFVYIVQFFSCVFLSCFWFVNKGHGLVLFQFQFLWCLMNRLLLYEMGRRIISTDIFF